jgi:hypothetical protein
MTQIKMVHLQPGRHYDSKTDGNKMKWTEYGMKKDSENFLLVNLCNMEIMLTREDNIFMPGF